MKILLLNTEYISAAKHSTRNKRRKTSRDVTNHMIRCRSSNVWGYAFDIQQDEDTGTMYVQFKSAKGGPGDIYCYYDVPFKIYQKFISRPSKGNAVWKYLRNVYLYRKLTGDKKTHLKNGL